MAPLVTKVSFPEHSASNQHLERLSSEALSLTLAGRTPGWCAESPAPPRPLPPQASRRREGQPFPQKPRGSSSDTQLAPGLFLP